MILWNEWLREKKVLIADGGWGTEFVQRGLGPGEAPEAWNLERRADVLAVASSYVQAGAEIILTNTFGGTRMKLAKGGLDGKTGEVNQLGARISKEAAGNKSLVFGSIGPTGEFMVPLGRVTAEQMKKDFAEQAMALAKGGADGIVIETMTDLAEAKVALRAVKESTNLPVAVTMTFDKGKRDMPPSWGFVPNSLPGSWRRTGRILSGQTAGPGSTT